VGVTEAQNMGENLIMKSIHIGKKSETKEQSVEANPSLEELIKNSDIIVIGKITHVDRSFQMGRGEEASPSFSWGSIEVSRVLKGDKNIKTVLLAMPAFVTIGNGWYQWDGPIYPENLKGVWFLTKNPEGVSMEIVNKIKLKGVYYFANIEGRYREFDKSLIDEILSIFKKQNLGKEKGTGF